MGRPKGVPNGVTRELREFWHKFFSSAEYRESAKRRILSGSAPHIETYLFNRIYGKPRERVELQITEEREDLSLLSDEELAERAEAIAATVRESVALEKALAALEEARQEPVQTLVPFVDFRSEDVTAAAEGSGEPSVLHADRTTTKETT
jgi:hypothetical protein